MNWTTNLSLGKNLQDFESRFSMLLMSYSMSRKAVLFLWKGLLLLSTPLISFIPFSSDIGALIPMEKVQYVPTYMYKVPATDNEIKEMLTNIKSKTPASEFVVAGSVKVADRILTLANDLGMISNIMHWFVVTRDLESLTCAGCGNNQVIQIRHEIKSPAIKSALATAVGSSWANLGYRQVSSLFIALKLHFGELKREEL